MLFGELKRVRNTNSTRGYLGAVVGVPADMPPALVRPGFEELTRDTTLWLRMRAKFGQVLDRLDYQEWRGPLRRSFEQVPEVDIP